MTPVSTRPTGTVPIANLVDILKGETEGLVGRSDRGFNGINCFEESEPLRGAGLGFFSPTLEPSHVGGLFNHVVAVPSRDGDEGNGLGVVTDFLDEV